MSKSNTTPPNHAESVQRIGQEEFVALLVRHDRRLRGFIATLLGRIADIDEVLQNVCLVAWKKVDQFCYQGASADEEFVRWICTIARYEIMTYRRTEDSSLLLLDASLMDRLAEMQIAESSYIEDRYKALVGCIQRLRPRDREMVRQRYEANLSAHDLAAAFEVGVNAIYKALTRIRATLLECVQRRLSREEVQ